MFNTSKTITLVILVLLLFQGNASAVDEVCPSCYTPTCNNSSDCNGGRCVNPGARNAYCTCFSASGTHCEQRCIGCAGLNVQCVQGMCITIPHMSNGLFRENLKLKTSSPKLNKKFNGVWFASFDVGEDESRHTESVTFQICATNKKNVFVEAFGSEMFSDLEPASEIQIIDKNHFVAAFDSESHDPIVVSFAFISGELDVLIPSTNSSFQLKNIAKLKRCSK